MSVGKSRAFLIIFVGLSQFSTAFMHSIMGVTLPPMGTELNASGVELGLTETIFLGTAAALLLPIGHFADATDKNTLFKAGLIALSITTFAIGLQASMTGVITARFAQAVAAALLNAIGMAIVTDIAPRGQLGRMLGLAIGATYFGLATGPFFAGLITTHLCWQWVFYLAALPPMLAYLLSRSALQSRWRPPVTSTNLTSSAILVAAIATFVAGSATLGQHAYGYLLVALGFILGSVFVFVERRSRKPLLQLDAIRANQPLARALTVQFLIYCGTVGTTFLLSIYLQVLRGYSPAATGHILVIGPIAMALMAPVAGRLSEIVAPQRICAVGAALILCSVSLAALVDAQTGLAHMIAIMIFQGLGFAAFSAPNITIIMNSVRPGERSLASALSAVMRSLGMVVSMSVVTAAISIRLGTNAVAVQPTGFLSVMTSSFVVFAALTALGAVLAVRAKGSGRPDSHDI